MHTSLDCQVLQFGANVGPLMPLEMPAWDCLVLITGNTYLSHMCMLACERILGSDIWQGNEICLGCAMTYLPGCGSQTQAAGQSMYTLPWLQR